MCLLYSLYNKIHPVGGKLLVKSHTAYEHMTQKYEQILLIKPKTFKSLSERSRLFGGQSKTHQYM